MIFKLRAIREAKNIPMKKMADDLGIALSTLSQIEKGKINLSIDKLEPIADLLDINISELFGEEVSNNIRLLKIKYYSILPNYICNNENEFNKIIDKSSNYEIFNVDKNSLSIINILNILNNIISFKYNNSSMLPTIQDKDLIFVDLSDRNIIDNKIYLINEGNSLKIRRIKQKNPLLANFKITSDNKNDMDYKEYNLSEEQLKKIIYGRIIFYTRNVF